jgi:hypothetical protein
VLRSSIHPDRPKLREELSVRRLDGNFSVYTVALKPGVLVRDTAGVIGFPISSLVIGSNILDLDIQRQIRVRFSVLVLV